MTKQWRIEIHFRDYSIPVREYWVGNDREARSILRYWQKNMPHEEPCMRILSTRKELWVKDIWVQDLLKTILASEKKSPLQEILGD